MKLTLATKITIARIFLIIPTILFYILAHFYIADRPVFIGLSIVAGVLFAICCSTDFVDGHIARKTNTVSMLGKFLDPLADKVVIVVMLFLIVVFNYGLDLNGVYPANSLVIAILSGIILSRELMIGVFRSIAASRGLVLAADIYGKIKTVCLDVGVTFIMLAGLHEVIGWIGTIVFYIGSFFAIYSGINYVVKNKHVLEQKDEECIEDVNNSKELELVMDDDVVSSEVKKD